MNRPHRRKRRAAPRVELLEDRLVLSTVHPGDPGVSAALLVGLTYLQLNGSAHGTTHREPPHPDIGEALDLQGTGRFRSLGLVHISGTLHGTGFISRGEATGALQLSNRRGTVTVNLMGPEQRGFTPPPSAIYQFTITGGTGAYAHVFGTGKVAVTLASGKFTLVFHGKPSTF